MMHIYQHKKSLNKLISFILSSAHVVRQAFMPDRVHHERNQPFTLDCMDVEGRAAHGAVAESLPKGLPE